VSDSNKDVRSAPPTSYDRNDADEECKRTRESSQVETKDERYLGEEELRKCIVAERYRQSKSRRDSRERRVDSQQQSRVPLTVFS